MTKRGDLDEYVLNKRIEDSINKRVRTWIMVCVSATSAILGGMYAIGNFVYTKWEPIKAAMRAFMDTDQ